MVPPQAWKTETLYFSGDDYFSAVMSDIESAQISILLETYIFDLDSLGAKVVEALKAAAARGVKVQILIDGFGSIKFRNDLQNFFSKTENLELKIYHPFYVLKNINNRLHRKTWIFDQYILYTGSINISEVHTRFYSEPWKDCAIRVEGDEIEFAVQAFKKSWLGDLSLSNILSLKSSPQSHLVRLNSSTIKRRRYNRILLEKLKGASSRVWIGNAYFSPHLRLLWNIRKCARRGLDVRIVVPHRSDVFFMNWVTSSYYQILYTSGVKIYEYLPSVYHAKIFVADDWMIVGSSNLNYRSTFHDLEMDVQVTHEKNKNLLLNEMESQFLKSKPIDKEYFMSLSWSHRIFGPILTGFFLLFKWWI